MVAGLRARMTQTPEPLEQAAVGPWLLFGLAGGVGLVGAFVGLGVSSLWFDELVTAWVVGSDHSLSAVVSRILCDVHPPVYYLSVFAFSELAGAGDAELRAFSALCACSSVLVLVLATARSFSLPGRLFAAALATGSGFWFYQAQNARNYSLTLLIGAGILALALRLLTRPDRPGGRPVTIATMAALMLLGEMTHYYLMFESVAVLLVLGVWRRDARAAAGLVILVLATLAFAYMKFVVQPHTLFPTTQAWIHKDTHWFRGQIQLAAGQAVNVLAAAAVAVCAAMALWISLGASGARSNGPPSVDPVMTLCAGVPVLVGIMGVSSSLLLTPNVTDRNLLIASPFIWGLFAWLYDKGPGRARGWPRLAADLLLAALSLGLATIVLGRSLPLITANREAADWIRAQPACRDQSVLTVMSASSGRLNGGADRWLYPLVMQRYVQGYSPLTLAYSDTVAEGLLPAAEKAELIRRLGGKGCPVLLWVTHTAGADAGSVHRIVDPMLAHLGGPGVRARTRIQSFQVYRYGLRRDRKDSNTYILYVEPPPSR